MDVQGIKGGGMVVFCVGVVVVGIVDEMGVIVIGRITKGAVEIGGVSRGIVLLGGINRGVVRIGGISGAIIVILGGIIGGIGDETIEEEGEDLGDSRDFCTT